MKLYQVQSSCNYSDCWVNVMKGRRELTVDISSCVSRTAELTQPITSVPSRPRNCIISICLLPCLPFHYKFPLTKCKLNLNECLTPLKATISLRSDFTYLLPFSIQIKLIWCLFRQNQMKSHHDLLISLGRILFKQPSFSKIVFCYKWQMNK